MTSTRILRHLCTISLLLVLFACAGGPPVPVGDGGGKHTLWKVSSRSGTVYLLGSVHLMKQGDYPLAPALEKAYQASRQLYFEINLAKEDEQSLKQMALERGTFSNIESLEAALSTDAYALTKQTLYGRGLDIRHAERLKPWLLAMTLALTELQRLGYDPAQGVDRYYLKRAVGDGKRIDGLETGEYQLSLLADMSPSLQEQFLVQSMRDLDQTSARMAALIRAWKTGNVEGIESTMLRSVRNYPEIYKRLIVNRNRKWMPKIEELLARKESTMVIVGAGHLVGPDGLVAVLRQKGYQVEQQ